jgi:NaMN:DMB phosphoribosyltransferase
MKISAYLLCMLSAAVVGLSVASYAHYHSPLIAGGAVYAALLFFVQLADGIRRGP